MKYYKCRMNLYEIFRMTLFFNFRIKPHKKLYF